MTRRMLSLLTLGLAGLLAASVASARNLKEEASVLRVFLGGGDTVSHEEVVIGKKFWKHPDRYLLLVSLEEVPTGGGTVFIGEQVLPLTGLSLIAENAATKQVVLDVEWSSNIPIAAGSSIFACAQVFQVLSDGGQEPASDEECRVINPELDL